MWKYTHLLETFNADPKNSKSYQVRTRTELDSLLQDKEFSSAKRIQLVEVFMPKHDAPRALEVTAQATGKLNEMLSDS